MALLEALLLDPYRMDVWIAKRTDGVAGTGTQNDPLDGSTQAKFDAVMNGVAAYTCVHLGPGTFQTNGYSDNASGGWQPKAGMKIVGSGVDVTILQAAGSSTSSAHFYAVGHAVKSGSQPISVDFFEISDLTVDCNLTAFTGTSVASGAVRVLGNHAKVRRLKVINWGTKSTSQPCFVVSVITATDLTWVEDCAIEECIAVSPGTTGNTGPMTVFHAGAIEQPQTAPQGYGLAPYIRNCFVDGSPSTLEVRGLSMAWSKAGIIEGNQAHNLTYGVFQQPTNTQDLVIRNNWFKNVNKGILVGALEPTQTPARAGTLNASGGSGSIVLSSGSLPAVGDCVLLTTNPTTTAFNGIVVAVQTVTQSPSTFTFNTSSSGSNVSVTSVLKVFGVGNAAGLGNFPAPGSLTIDGNVIELVTATSGSGIIGLHLNDSWAASSASQDPVDPTYVFARVIIRDNKFRYLDGVPYAGFVGYGMQLNNAMDLLVRNNVVETIPATPPAIQNDRCGSVVYFNNLQPTGQLIQGFNADNNTSYEELATEADFALVMGLFNRRH